MEGTIYITPELLRSKIAEDVNLNPDHYSSLFSKSGLVGRFTPEELVFKSFLTSVKKLSTQINKLNLDTLTQKDVNDAITRLEIAALTQIDEEAMTMKFDLQKFGSNKTIMSVLHVLSPNVIQYVALKRGLKLESGTTFFANNHPSQAKTKRLVRCKKVDESELIVSLGKKYKVDYSNLLPAEATETPSAPKTDIKDK